MKAFKQVTLSELHFRKSSDISLGKGKKEGWVMLLVTTVMRETGSLNLDSGDRKGRRNMITHESSWASLQTWWKRRETVKSVTKPRFLTKSKERMVISTDIGIPRAKSSLGIKRMSFDLDRFNSTNLDIYLRAQPTSVQKAAGGKKKRNCGWHSLYYWTVPYNYIHFNISMVRKIMLDMEKFLEMNMSTCHAF